MHACQGCVLPTFCDERAALLGPLTMAHFAVQGEATEQRRRPENTHRGRVERFFSVSSETHTHDPGASVPAKQVCALESGRCTQGGTGG